ncbi:hypothetical protein K488DRAFT_9072, partial [Vararia minispora EC-137]
YPWPINMVHYYVLAPGADGLYARQPSLRLYTYSALDLFATTDAVIGPHGTALWIDSYAEAGTIGGQRIAGKMLHPMLHADDVDQLETEESLNDARTFVEPDPRTYDRGTTMVFGVLERAEAFKLAVDEEAGRIAVGFTDGRIEVWNY